MEFINLTTEKRQVSSLFCWSETLAFCICLFRGYFSTKKQQEIEKQFVTSAKTPRLTPPPTQTTQTHSNRHNNTTVYQIMGRASSHDRPAENPCTWLIQNPQKRHSWDWQHHLRVKTERRGGDGEGEKNIKRYNRNVFGGRWKSQKVKPNPTRQSKWKRGRGPDAEFQRIIWWKTSSNILIRHCALEPDVFLCVQHCAPTCSFINSNMLWVIWLTASLHSSAAENSSQQVHKHLWKKMNPTFSIFLCPVWSGGIRAEGPLLVLVCVLTLRNKPVLWSHS